MRWAPYFILVYIVLGLQTGLDGFLRINGTGPNLVLLVVIFIALNAPRDAALLGCFAIGLVQDLTTRQALGLFAFSYGIIATLLVGAQGAVNRDHPMTHFSSALGAGLVTSVILLIHGLIHPAAAAQVADAGVPLPAIRYAPMSLVTTTIYTAIVAPVFLGVLNRIKRPFSFQQSRRKMRAW